MKNIVALNDNIERLFEFLSLLSFGLGFLSGLPGSGKTTGTICYCDKMARKVSPEYRPAWIRCLASDTLRSFLKRLATELGLLARYITNDIHLQVIENFLEFPRPLIIDEIDRLVQQTAAIACQVRGIYVLHL